jgi:DNA-binding NtrC family response regulator
MHRACVSNSVALLAEPDRALRHLMYGALTAAGYEVFESSNVAQVEVALRVRAVYRAKNLLCVLASKLAADCAPGISAAALERAQWGLPEAQVILTCEFGTLPMAPHITRCQVRGVLEKPFDLYELQALAFECRDFLCESGANDASS